MRFLTLAVLTASVFLSGCTTLQRYPSFGTASGGRFIYYDRSGARNLIPPQNHNAATHPAPVDPVSPVE